MPPKKRGGGRRKKAGIPAKRNSNSGGNSNATNNHPRTSSSAAAARNAASNGEVFPRYHPDWSRGFPSLNSASVASDEPPPLMPRTGSKINGHGDSSSSDCDSDSDNDLASTPGDDSDFSQGPPPMTHPRNEGSDSDDSTSEDVPNLMPRQYADTSSNDSDQLSSDDEDGGEIPGLTTNDHSSGSSSSEDEDGGNRNARRSSRPSSSNRNRKPAPGLKRGFLNRTNEANDRSLRGQRLDETARRDEERRNIPEKAKGKKETEAKKKAENARKKEEEKVAEARREKQRKERERLEAAKRKQENDNASSITTFIVKNHLRRRAQNHYRHQLQAIIKLQSWARMLAASQAHAEDLQARFALAREYLALWGKLEKFVQTKLPEYEEFNWEDIKMKRLDRMNVESDIVDEEILESTNKKMESAIVTALKSEDEEAKPLDDESYEFVSRTADGEESDEEDAPPMGEELLSLPPTHKIDQIQLTKDVLKWLDRQDSKYRGFFIRRIRQLADGERSRILKKHLTGSKTAIWETYLDQKSGQRILWTECETFHTRTADSKPDIEKGILVWFVAKHDAVNRLMRQIDRAEDRSSEQLTSALTLFKEAKDHVLQLDDGNRILADPMGDTPLKLHLLYRDDIRKLTSKEWKPRLHLTAEELKVVDKDGTVLVLGRSGTGKTICIANRMDRDRERDPNVSQLFVARSRRICSYVRGLVEGSAAPSDNVQYLTFARFIERCERILRIQRRHGGGDWGDGYDPDQMTFPRFKLEVYKQATFELDALIVWSQIRSFIKGSVEAVKSGRPLTRDEYLRFGKSRCRLSKRHRELAYSAYEAYHSFMQADPDLWDETDRVLEILYAIRRASPDTLSELSSETIFIDEVQDFSQAELALFFYLGRPGGLFLAGDTAQSVSWGVDFRFEEVRSIGYTLFEDRKYVPDKPVTVNINFRSHSGILNVAAAVLDRMFEAFPKSANTLAPDVGAFTGPRPSLLRDLTPDKLRALVSLIDSVVLLTHDEHVQDLKDIVGENVLVLGIRHSKGLEFPHVVIIDFFCWLNKSLHKAWRNLLSIRTDNDAAVEDLKDTAPEIETQLKLLYTAITRCSKRLFFAETKKSMAGDAFCKWMLKKNEKPLASEQTVDNVDVLRKTADEWVASGVDFGMLAESVEDDLQQAHEYLTQAKYDFGRANDSEFGKKAEAHLKAIDFQINMRDFITGADSRLPLAQQEKAAEAIFDLLQHGLVEEASRLLNLVRPFVSTYCKKRLMKEVATFVPSRHD